MDPAAVLRDGVLTLSPVRLDDAGPHLAGEDAELVRWYTGGASTRQGVEAYLQHAIDRWAAGGPKLSFGIRIHGGCVLVGTVDVDLALPSLAPPEANLAYGLYPAWRRRGLATRAVLLACRYLRERGDVDRARVVTDPRNRASAAVAARAGFRPIASRTNADGEHMDVRVRDVSSAVPPLAARR